MTKRNSIIQLLAIGILMASCVPSSVAFRDGTAIAICPLSQKDEFKSAVLASMRPRQTAGDIVEDIIDFLRATLETAKCIMPSAIDLAREAKMARISATAAQMAEHDK